MFFFLKTIMCHTLVEWPWPESYGVIFIISYLTLSVIFLVHFIQWYHCIILDCCQVFTPVYYWASLPFLFSFSRHSKFCLHLFHFVTSYWSWCLFFFFRNHLSVIPLNMLWETLPWKFLKFFPACEPVDDVSFLRGLLLPRLPALPRRLVWEQSSSSRVSIRPAPSTGQSVGWSTLPAPRTGPVLWDAWSGGFSGRAGRTGPS